MAAGIPADSFGVYYRPIVEGLEIVAGVRNLLGCSP